MSPPAITVLAFFSIRVLSLLARAAAGRSQAHDLIIVFDAAFLLPLLYWGGFFVLDANGNIIYEGLT